MINGLKRKVSELSLIFFGHDDDQNPLHLQRHSSKSSSVCKCLLQRRFNRHVIILSSLNSIQTLASNSHLFMLYCRVSRTNSIYFFENACEARC